MKQVPYEFIIVHRPDDALPSVVASSSTPQSVLFAPSPGDACEMAKRFIPDEFRDRAEHLEIIVRPF